MTEIEDNSPPEFAIIVHLTDFHIKNSSSTGAVRIPLIAPALGSIIEPKTAVVLVLTGDIAFSGLKEEYSIATQCLEELKKLLFKWSPHSIHVVTSPGNHDCDFTLMPKVARDALLSSNAIETPAANEIIEALSGCQSNYYSFSSNISSEKQSKLSLLVYESICSIGSFNIRFLSLNTSWSSSIGEKPGSLRMPDSAIPTVTRETDFCAILAHHPLNWFVPGDAVRLSEWFNSNADLVMTGHEHRIDQFRISRDRGGSIVAHQIGLPMEDGAEQCGFLCMRINIAKKEVTHFEGSFDRKNSVHISEKKTGPLQRNDARNVGVVRFSEVHRSFLGDPGAGYLHPRVNRPLEMQDIFVAPDFREFRTDKSDNERLDGNLGADEVCKFILEKQGKIVVFGNEQSGKTTFAKYGIEYAKSRHKIPVYLDGNNLTSSNRGEVRGWYRSAVKKQFCDDSIELVEQIPPDELIIFLDNVQSLPGGPDGYQVIVEFIDLKAKNICLLTSENPALSMLAATASTEESIYWKEARAFELLPLGHKRRGELIRKWISIGRDIFDDAVAIESEVRQTKMLLDRILGKSSLPKYPLFVLVLMQQLEGMKDSKTAIANGSHGYLFEALINQAIDKNVRSHEISTVSDFLADLAREIHLRNSSLISLGGINNIIDSFRMELVEVDSVRLLKELYAARILIEEEGGLRFRYPYLFYYYLAKWICDRCDEDGCGKALDELISLIHTEKSSNVLVFVAHLKQEKPVLERLIPLVDSLFSDSDECEFASYSSLLLRFRTSAQRAYLLQGPAHQVSDETHGREDSFDANRASQDDNNVEDTLKLNTTLKAIGTLGQILKSRATSLPAEQKIKIAESSISTSRRLMSFLYDLIQDNAEEIVHSASNAFEESFKLNKQEAVTIANSMIGFIVCGIARLCVSRSADSIASAELKPLLQRLEKNGVDQEARLIILVARVIGDKVYPKEDVEDFIRSLKPSNLIPVSVLSAAVARRFYLDPPERGIRDSACELLGIDVRKLPGGSRSRA